MCAIGGLPWRFQSAECIRRLPILFIVSIDEHTDANPKALARLESAEGSGKRSLMRKFANKIGNVEKDHVSLGTDSYWLYLIRKASDAPCRANMQNSGFSTRTEWAAQAKEEEKRGEKWRPVGSGIGRK